MPRPEITARTFMWKWQRPFLTMTHDDHTKVCPEKSRSHLIIYPVKALSLEKYRHEAFFKYQYVTADYIVIIWALIQNKPRMVKERIETNARNHVFQWFWTGQFTFSGTCIQFTDLWRALSTAASEQLGLWWTSCLWGSPEHSHTLHTQTQWAERDVCPANIMSVNRKRFHLSN